MIAATLRGTSSLAAFLVGTEILGVASMRPVSSAAARIEPVATRAVQVDGLYDAIYAYDVLAEYDATQIPGGNQTMTAA